ncbi:MAG TPA: outer membrane protein [Xanthobacteraceae bacterium]|jgi:outer membrane immunogenic protein|nr:outer membrane protein [Xanthobacteraceae bacterium]
MTKRLLLASVATLALVAAAGSASAADLARPVYKAPPPMAPVFSWNGFYIGGHIGGAFEREDATDVITGATASTDPSGFIGGGQLGFNYQFAPNWVLGLEGDISGTSVDGTADFDPLVFGAPATIKDDVNFYATLTGRLGFTVQPNWLLYVKGGAAWKDSDYTLTTGGLAEKISNTRTGWTVGGGLEYAFYNNWSAKLEYDFLDFGTDRLDFLAGPQDIKSETHQVKFGINYRFGGVP